jgi:hypothetical protein
MTTQHRLHRHYDKLTTVERINLALAAQQRGDETELFTLENRCSMAQAIDYDYQWFALAQVASVLVIQLLARQVLIVKRFTTLARTSPATVETGAHPASFPDDDSLYWLLEQATAIWRGFVAWCQGAGHDPNLVLRLAPIGLDESNPAHFVIHHQIHQLEEWAALMSQTGAAAPLISETGAAAPLISETGAAVPFPCPETVELWRATFAQILEPIDAT